jgi:hypothetical protein
MKSRYALVFVFCLAVIATGVVVYSFIPTVLLSPAIILSIVILSLSVGLTIYLPISSSRDANIGLIGPASVASIFFVFTSGGVLAASFFLPSVQSYTLSFANLALFAIAWVVLRFASEHIEAETARATRSDIRRALSARIKQLCTDVRDPVYQQALLRIAEEVSHSADSAFHAPNKFIDEIELIVSKIEALKISPENTELYSSIDSLERSVTSLKNQLDSARL